MRLAHQSTVDNKSGEYVEHENITPTSSTSYPDIYPQMLLGIVVCDTIKAYDKHRGWGGLES
jgi:hypothetical protein